MSLIEVSSPYFRCSVCLIGSIVFENKSRRRHFEKQRNKPGFINFDVISSSRSMTVRALSSFFISQLCETHLKHIKTHQNTPKHTSKHIKTQSKHIKTHQNTSQHIKSHQNTSKLIKAHQNTSKHIKIHQPISNHIKTSMCFDVFVLVHGVFVLMCLF